MTITDRRRALMGAQGDNEPKTPIMPSCTNWIYRDGGGFENLSLSDDSFYLNNANDWNHYCYAWNTLTKKYSALVGKTLVCEWDSDKALASFGVGVISKASGDTGGVSNVKDRKSFNSLAYHRKEEIVIGTDYTTTNTGYYLTVYFFANSSTDTSRVTVTNFKCYIKGE